MGHHFPPVRIQGETLHLSHLEPFTLEVESDKAPRPLRVSVMFSNHCFTRSLPPDGSNPEGLPVLDADKPRPRLFCPTRYQLTHDLPSIVRNLSNPQAKVQQTKERRNWVYSITISNPSGPYHVFFEIRKTPKPHRRQQDLNMFVESAYHETDKAPGVLGKMKFVMLCGKVYREERVTTRR